MAKYLPYNDSVFLFRLQILIIDGGTEVVRNVFNNRLNNLPLVTFLANEQPTINRLKARRTISNVQYEKLFPPGGQQPDSGDFDITLLICLLSSIPFLGLNMTYPWHTSPGPTDTSEESDLIRLRTFRNEIAHASTTHCLDKLTYEQQWNEVEQCLLRLNDGPQSDPNLQATIDSFKNSLIEPASKRRLDKQWQDLGNFLESKLNIKKEDLTPTIQTIMQILNKSKGDDHRTHEKDVQIGLYPECSPEEMVHKAEELLNAAFHKARQRVSNRVSQNTEDTEEFDQVVYSMIDRISKRDATFKGSEVKCVMLTFQCTSHASLKWLLEYFQSPDFQTHLKRIAAALKKRLNIEGEVAITSNFTEENLQNILEIIGAQDEGSGSLSECRRNRVRDLKGEENTSERNWKMLEKVRQKEDAGRMAGLLRLDEDRHNNWVKGATGLKFVHEGLKDMVCTTSRYQTTPNLGKSADETDAAGLLSIILNNTYFQADIACNLAVPGNSFATARDIRNNILHSPKMELEDLQLQSYLDVFINVLQDKKKLFNDAKAKESVNKLVELKNNQITISMNEEIPLIQMRKDALSALEQLQEKGKVLTAVDSTVASAIGTLELNDLHKRLKETEEAMKILTETVQQVKPSNSGGNEQDSNNGDLRCCDFVLWVLSILVIILTLPFAMCLCIKEVQEYKRNVIFQLGRLLSRGAKEPEKDIGEVTGDVSKVKGDIVVITGDVDKASENVREMEGGNGRIGGKVDNLEEQVQNLDTELSLNQQRREDVSTEEGAQDEGSGSISECGTNRVRDLKGEENTSERNWKKLEKVRQKEDAGRMAGLLRLDEDRHNNWVRGATGLKFVHEGLKDMVCTTSRYQTTPNLGKSADETDAAGLLSIILNNKYFQADIACNLAVPGNSFATARDIRNTILHSPKMELEDSHLQSYLDVFINVLQDKKKLFNDAQAKESVNKLVQLKNNQITKSMNEEIPLIQMRKDALSALEQLQEKGKVLTAVDSTVASAIGTLELNDLHKRLKETEEAMKILTETVQQVKPSNSGQSVTTNPTSQQRPFSFLGRIREKFRRKRMLKLESREVEEPAISESKYNIQIQKLQEDLIDSYRSDHSKMHLAPLLDKGTPFLQLYQMPDLELVTERMEQDRAVKEVRTPVDTWNKLFHDSNHANHRSTYICADAGLGKTAFSKYLALAWCQSKKPLQEESQFFKPEHLEAIGEFRFVFLLFLCESGESKCHLKEMVWEQLVSLISSQQKDLENILRNEKCLIILDGLDEWTHPPTCAERDNVPHWSKRENVAVITTTRPWKFSVAGLKSEQVDQRIELTGLNQYSAYNLKYSFMSYFKMQKLSVKCLGQQDKDDVSRHVQKFTKTVSDKHATKLESVPLMLMYMLFLDSKGFDLGETQCDLYCQIIELLLSRTFEEELELVTSTTEKIPPCFNKRKHCLKFYNHNLKPLGELAFKTLLEEKREENTLVFDTSVAIKCLGEECFKQCLKTGIISQSKCVQTHPLIRKSTVSFSHKTIQEFFAALNMYSAPDDIRMSQLVLSKCKNTQDILDMSQIIMFISGMDGNVASLISCGMMDIINEDEITQKSRNTTELGSDENPLRDLQNMFISCCKEMQCASGDNLYIQDVFIDRDCEDEQYCVNLKQLIQHNKNNIKSVYINMEYMEDCTPYNSVQKVVEYFELKDLKNIVKIYCLKGKDKENIIPVLNTQVKCLELAHGSWSRSLCEKVTSLQKLEVIYIHDLTMSHSELRLLYDFISQKVDMRHIELQVLNCSDHKWRSCSDLSLDLAQHSQLRKLTLWGIPLSELNINMTSLARCALRVLSLSYLVFTHGTCDTVNSEVNKSDVSLDRVTIPASVLKDLVTVIQTFPHTVCVEIEGCGIKPESEWETLKQQIKTSPHFTVLEEDDSWSKFSFETIKHGN